MNKNELQMLGFEIVAYSGDARSCLLNLLKEVRQGDFTNVDAALKEADENLNLAHNSQTQISTRGSWGRFRFRIYLYSRSRSFDDDIIVKRIDRRFY